MENQKLTTEELTSVTTLMTQFNKLKLRIGDIELERSKTIKQIDLLQEQYFELEKSLADKYGGDTRINIETGEVIKNEKPVEEKERTEAPTLTVEK